MQHTSSVSQVGCGSHLSLGYFDLPTELTIAMTGRVTAEDQGSRIAYKNGKEKAGALVLLWLFCLITAILTGFRAGNTIMDLMPMGRRIPVNEQKITFFQEDVLDRQEAVWSLTIQLRVCRLIQSPRLPFPLSLIFLFLVILGMPRAWQKRQVNIIALTVVACSVMHTEHLLPMMDMDILRGSEIL